MRRPDYLPPLLLKDPVFLCVIFQSSCRPVEWIKKWFLRKRKADGKNRTLTPTMPTFVENEPPARDGQTLGHAHSKFWSVDAFVAADSNSFSPSVGHIPKFYGHHRHNLPSGNPDDRTTDSRANEEEREIMSQEASAGIGDGHTASCRSVETTTPTTYNLREALLGVDAFPRHLPPSVDEDASGSHSEQFNVTLAVDDPGSTMFLEASSTEYSVYPDDSHDEPFSGSESITDLGFTLTNYSLSSGSSPFDTIDDLILASKDLEFISAISYDATKDLGLDSFDPATGRLNPNPGSFSDFPDVSNCVASTFGDSSASYESLLLQATSQDLTGDSVSLTDCSSLLDIDFYLGAGADRFSFRLAGLDLNSVII